MATSPLSLDAALRFAVTSNQHSVSSRCLRRNHKPVNHGSSATSRRAHIATSRQVSSASKGGRRIVASPSKSQSGSSKYRCAPTRAGNRVPVIKEQVAEQVEDLKKGSLSSPLLDSTNGSPQGSPGPSDEGPGWIASMPAIVVSCLANFCFGYHIGASNGLLDSIAQELGFAGDTIMQGWVVSIFLVGAFIGSVGGGSLADIVGRRRNFQLDTIPLILGSILSATAQSPLSLEFGRFLIGIGVGAAAGFVPLYISEIAPTKYRGALGCLCQVGTCSGIITSLLVSIPAEADPHWWRSVFWIANVPALALAVGMQFSPESPRWLSKKGRWDEARRVLTKLWGESQVEAAMQELKDADQQEQGEQEASWLELASPRYVKVAVIGGMLFVLQQFAGINGVLYFSSSTFRDVGIENGMLASAAVGVANLAGALTVVPLMDRQGRRTLLMGSYGGMALTMAVLVAAVAVPMPVEYSHALSVAGMLGYCYIFALGAGPATALIIPELCSTRIRAKTLAFSLCVHWVCNFLVGLFFLELVQKFGLGTIYGAFGVVSLLSVAFANSYIIETKGRSLEDIERELNPNLELE